MMLDPSVQEAELCAVAQQEIVETLNRLIEEGIDRRIVSASLAAAASAAVLKFYGAAEVSPWFAKQAVLTAHLAGIKVE